MNNVQNFDQFLNESKLQDDYRDLFSFLLKKYDVKSPLEFKNKQDVAENFYEELGKCWTKGEGLTKYGKELMSEDKTETAE